MAHLIKLDTKEYTISLEEFHRRFPNTSITSQIPFNDLGYAVVFPAPQPAYDTATEQVEETVPKLTSKGHWEQRWKIVPR